ncbi:hypothetical protein DIPPA_12328 [Diplonema papillatum]|nr:hypothetical protein DIPPA_12328 [Diplonema papillatum]
MSLLPLPVIRNKIAELLVGDKVYENETWWQFLAGHPYGVPLDTFQKFGGGLENVTGQQVVEAFARQPHRGVVVENGTIRPVDLPSEESHPNKRTIFATPIPFQATEREIKRFFEVFGPVDAIIRREWLDMSAAKDTHDSRAGVRRKKPSVLIKFATPAAAAACIAAQPQFLLPPAPLGRFFIPKLTCSQKQDTPSGDTALTNEYVYQTFQRPADVKPNTAEPLALSETARELCHTRFVVKMESIPGGTTWRDLRAHYQHTSKNDNRGEHTKVAYILHNTSANVAYFFCKNQEVASSLVGSGVMRGYQVHTVPTNEEDIAYLSSLPIKEMPGGAQPKKKMKRNDSEV